MDAAALTAALVDVPSVSGAEGPLADLVEAALRDLGHLEVVRSGDAVLARTHLGRERRVLLAGHLDTVPIAGNVPSRREGDRIVGCGTSDMKSGDAVLLRLLATLTEPRYDLTAVCYDCEEVSADRNGLGRIAAERPEWLDADLAVLLEPTAGQVEAGCQGTLRAVVPIAGVRAHSARSWLGDNAIHRAAPLLRRLAEHRPRTVDIDGCRYREGLNAVGITGGVAGNVIPDLCEVTLNYRFAPDLSPAGAEEWLRQFLAGVDGCDPARMRVVDAAPGALPRLDAPAAAEFVAAVGQPPRAKYGWTDVSRFAQFGIPAVNYGPGDPNLAHTREEWVDASVVVECEQRLSAFLGGAAPPRPEPAG